MSLFGSLYSSVSALSAQSKSMSMISDNVANVNTTAYKGAEADFSSLVTRRPSSQSYSPGGVRAFTSYNVEQQGLIESSSSPTDVAISGKGFFVVNRSSGADGVPSEQVYTRDGSFSPDFKGNLKTSTGFFLQGWALDAEENIADINTLETVNTRTIQGVAAATTEVKMGANLDADAGGPASDPTVTPWQGFGYDPTAAGPPGNMAQFVDSGGATGVQPHFQRDLQIYDSLGRPRTVTAAFVRIDPDTVANPTSDNMWHMEIFGDPANLDATAHPDGLIAHGRLDFAGDGSLLNEPHFVDAATTAPMVPPATPNSDVTINWTAAAGAADSTITMDVGNAGVTTGLTQFSSPSDVGFVTQNGAEVGELNGVRIDEEGYTIASFTNGEERKLYKLPVATFPNPSALDPRSGNVYSQTDVAGEFNLRSAGSGGAGTITPSSLEAANVDIADELSKMIVTQRAYSASSKIISTADQLLEELLRISR
jgi:flagellar hook protein FlgE